MSTWCRSTESLPFTFLPWQSRLAQIDLFPENGGVREASVLRYKEKRRTRLFSKKIRYQVKKVNADRRPRMKVWLWALHFGYILCGWRNVKKKKKNCFNWWLDGLDSVERHGFFSMWSGTTVVGWSGPIFRICLIQIFWCIVMIRLLTFPFPLLHWESLS